MRNQILALTVLGGISMGTETLAQPDTSSRPRAREIGLAPGVLKPGPLNAITDVEGVLVGQVTIWEGESVRTGVTAILPHGGNLFQEKVPGAIYLGNAFGKLVGYTQVQELGFIETPIVLTNTLSVWEAANAVVTHLLALPGNEEVRSINPVIGETNDGTLNDIRGRHVEERHVLEALRGARGGPVAEGVVGAGTGTVAFGWKGGIGTSSRLLPESLGGYTVGILVQSNYGGVLSMDGLPVGVELGRYYLKDAVSGPEADGSIMMVVATDAPVGAFGLSRIAKRAMLGLSRTGATSSNGSGDYVIAFSTAPELRSAFESSGRTEGAPVLRNDDLSPLFQAAIEATEEAVYNSMLKAVDVVGRDGNRVEALPLDRILEIGKKYNRLHAPASGR
ncbi:MAG TPA: P1 family peptidase [Vicinamibacteria bacterium]|nr:P1 family peptidase [Vicinamibacteria bacterium]